VSSGSTLQFTDFDAFREHLQGWDTQPVQLGSGPLRIQWDELRLPDLSLASLEFDRHIADASAIRSGGLSFVVTHRPHLWCGLEVPAGSLVVLAPGREHRCAMRQGFRSLEISVSEGLLHEIGLIADAPHPRSLGPERCVIPLAPSHLAAFESIGKGLRSRAGSELTPAEADQLRWRALGTLGEALHSADLPGLRRVPFYDLAERALQTVDEDSKQRLSVRALAGALGVTPRALEYAFKSATGVSTSRFLLSRRLTQVRGDLVTGRSANVARAASGHGFRHMGRFSGQYQRLFGELPSRTRRPAEASLPHL